MRTVRTVAFPFSIALVLACGGAEEAAAPEAVVESAAKAPTRPDGARLGTMASKDRATRQRANGFAYRGGPMMLAPKNVYVVWYGFWRQLETDPLTPVQAALTDLVQNLGGSRYLDVVTSYRNAVGVAPTNSLSYAGALDDFYSRGAFLSRGDVGLVVAQLVAEGKLPADPDGVYVVVPSADVSLEGECSSTCAFHGTSGSGGTTLKFVGVVNTGRCPSRCAPQAVGPNGNSAADAMASLVAAELFNAVTDPELSAFYDDRGFEGADKCAWSYGATYRAANGARANVRLGSSDPAHPGGRDWLLQQLWVNATPANNGPKGNTCALSL